LITYGDISIYDVSQASSIGLLAFCPGRTIQAVDGTSLDPLAQAMQIASRGLKTLSQGTSTAALAPIYEVLLGLLLHGDTTQDGT